MNTTPFADRLHHSIQTTGSILCAGFDPVLEAMPRFLFEDAHADPAAMIEHALITYLEAALDAVTGKVATIKCNIAFFEQYGIGGLSALQTISKKIRARGIPLIIDCKRGDIGSTAEAYAKAFLTGYTIGDTLMPPAFEADAITVSPWLGFDTLEPFIKAAQRTHKGIFILVRTSNPGSAALQTLPLKDTNATDPASVVAQWCTAHSDALAGSCTLSGLGAVVGAPYPAELARIRSLMPKGFFLVPGLGTQGGSAKDIVPALVSIAGAKIASGTVVNVSRGLFSTVTPQTASLKELANCVSSQVAKFNQELDQILK